MWTAHFLCNLDIVFDAHINSLFTIKAAGFLGVGKKWPALTLSGRVFSDPRTADSCLYSSFSRKSGAKITIKWLNKNIGPQTQVFNKYNYFFL